MDAHFILDQAKAKLDLDAQGHLPLECRLHIWRAYGPVSDGGFPKPLTQPLQSRFKLAKACVEYLSNRWQFPETADSLHPTRLLSLVDRYFIGSIQENQLHVEIGRLWTFVDDISSEDSNEIWPLIGCAASQAASIALYDEKLLGDSIDITSEYDCDAYWWDAALYASAVYSQGFPWNSDSNCTLRREFWNWYLATAVPSAGHPFG